MSFLKKLKWNSIVTSIIFIILGLILIVAPGTTARTICYLGGGALIVMGIVSLINYFMHQEVTVSYSENLIMGIAELIIGLFIVVKADLVISIIPFLLGVFVTVSGIGKLQNALAFHRMSNENNTVLVVIAVLNIILGVVLMWNPFTAATVAFVVIGIGLVYSGVTDLISTCYLSKEVKKYQDKDEPIDVDGKFVD